MRMAWIFVHRMSSYIRYHDVMGRDLLFTCYCRGTWAACCDSLGRIIVLDLPSISIFRMFKGYRDAQIAWVTVQSRETPLLLIYAPKRRVVELWDILQGKRLVSTSKGIPEKGILIYRTHWEHSVSNTKVMLLDVHRLCLLQLDNTVCSAV